MKLKSRVICAKHGPTIQRHRSNPVVRSFAKVFVAQMGSLIGEHGSVIVLKPGSVTTMHDWMDGFSFKREEES